VREEKSAPLTDRLATSALRATLRTIAIAATLLLLSAPTLAN
jgi:hypothetical protein